MFSHRRLGHNGPQLAQQRNLIKEGMGEVWGEPLNGGQLFSDFILQRKSSCPYCNDGVIDNDHEPCWRKMTYVMGGYGGSQPRMGERKKTYDKLSQTIYYVSPIN